MKIRITNGMFMGMIINIVYTKSIGLTQGSIAREIGHDMWVATLLACLQGAAVMWLTVVIIRRLPHGDMMQQGEQLLGKWFAKGLALAFFLFFLGAFNAAMITFVYHLKDYFLPDAPLWTFVVVAVLISIYAVHFGLEVIARMSLVGVFAVISLNILLLFGSLQRFDVRELQPVLQEGIIPIAAASRHHTVDWLTVTMMAAVLLPFVKESSIWSRSSLFGIGFACMFIVMWPILESGVLSAEVAAQYVVSCMQMARSAQIGLFIHRYEMFMVAFFALSIFAQLMTILLCACISLQRLFGMKEYRRLNIPVCVGFGAVSYWIVRDHEVAMRLLEGQWVWLSFGIGGGLPLLMVVLGLIRRKKLRQSAAP